MKKISLSKKEEKWIREQIALSLSSEANKPEYEEYPDVQNMIWNNECFLFNKKYYSESPNWFIEELKLMKSIFDKLKRTKENKQKEEELKKKEI